MEEIQPTIWDVYTTMKINRGSTTHWLVQDFWTINSSPSFCPRCQLFRTQLWNVKSIIHSLGGLYQPSLRTTNHRGQFWIPKDSLRLNHHLVYKKWRLLLVYGRNIIASWCFQPRLKNVFFKLCHFQFPGKKNNKILETKAEHDDNQQFTLTYLYKHYIQNIFIHM